MWPFRAKTEAKTDARLTERVEELEREFKSIEIEWSEWFDKYRRLYARIAKRVERDEKDGGGQQSREDASETTKLHAEGGNGLRRGNRNLRGF
jgi:hypothetical protein